MVAPTFNGRTAFLKLLEMEGVTHLFGNPGTTELALMQALSETSAMRYVLGLQESIVLAMADGFARASGRLAVCNLHCAPGLGHALGALYNAKFSGSPVIVTAGQYEIGYGLREPMLYEPLAALAQPLVKWAYEVQRVQDLPLLVHRAAKVALTPPCGPVFLSLPGNILDDTAPLDLGSPTRVAAHGAPSDTMQASMVHAMLSSQAPVIIAGRELDEQNAQHEAMQLAECLGAPVYREPIPYNPRFPSEAPTFMGDLSRHQATAHDVLRQHDLLIVLGADLLRMSAYSDVDPMPLGLRVLHISERAWELGKNYPTDIAACAGVGDTLRSLLPRLQAGMTQRFAAAAQARVRDMRTRNWCAQRAAHIARMTEATAPSTPMDPWLLALAVANAVSSHDATLIEEAPTTAPLLAALHPLRRTRSAFGLASGGLGFAMGGAIGAALAQPAHAVVAMVGDGSALYAIQALWSAAHLNLPITYVIVNNRAYRIIKERMVTMRRCDAFLGMDLVHPEIDFVALGHSMGVAAQRVSERAALDEALDQSIRSRRPSLIDVTVDAGTQRV